MKRTFQPSNLVRKRRHGFRSRMATKNGRLVLARRRARPQNPVCLRRLFMTSTGHALSSLRVRRLFLAAAKADKEVRRGLIVQARARGDDEISPTPVRYGLTASKKIGNAVARNRARRRLRALAQEILPAGRQARFRLCDDRSGAYRTAAMAKTEK